MSSNVAIIIRPALFPRKIMEHMQVGSRSIPRNKELAALPGRRLKPKKRGRPTGWRKEKN